MSRTFRKVYPRYWARDFYHKMTPRQGRRADKIAPLIRDGHWLGRPSCRCEWCMSTHKTHVLAHLADNDILDAIEDFERKNDEEL